MPLSDSSTFYFCICHDHLFSCHHKQLYLQFFDDRCRQFTETLYNFFGVFFLFFPFLQYLIDAGNLLLYSKNFFYKMKFSFIFQAKDRLIQTVRKFLSDARSKVHRKNHIIMPALKSYPFLSPMPSYTKQIQVSSVFSLHFITA